MEGEVWCERETFSLPVSLSLCLYLSLYVSLSLSERERGREGGEASIAGETLEILVKEADWNRRPLHPTLKPGNRLRSGWVKGHPLSHFHTSAVRLEVTILPASPEVLDGLCHQVRQQYF